ncbi:hypothetical protein DSCOOX_24480 [Desulfosarcina ovata subsp. ovata]|uniref:Uncharacterized protein n=1 Tax=Desulfosarcina ovata subsp. ovata TaxID=2752305 RepID=A0A5K8A9X9_9BACT|nr:hypothetical protein DSCOOX_24480 [Desulfosarcina ovata subsp. ovata]
MIQIEIGIAIEIEKKWDGDMQAGCLATCGQWLSAPWETGKPGTLYRPFINQRFQYTSSIPISISINLSYMRLPCRDNRRTPNANIQISIEGSGRL